MRRHYMKIECRHKVYSCAELICFVAAALFSAAVRAPPVRVDKQEHGYLIISSNRTLVCGFLVCEAQLKGGAILFVCAVCVFIDIWPESLDSEADSAV